MTTTTLSKTEKHILDKVPDLYDDEVIKAMEYAKKFYKGQHRLSGQTIYQHALNVAKHAANINLDTVSIITALLHQALYEEYDFKQNAIEIKEVFGEEVYQLVEELHKINVAAKTKNIQSDKTLINYLTQGLPDLRIGLVKLCDTYENSMTIDSLPTARQKRIVAKLLTIYCPVAVFYNLYDFKVEMETTSLRMKHPNTYKAISKELVKRSKNSPTIKKIQEHLSNIIEISEIDAKIYGRQKSPYSIYRKQYKQFNEDIEVKFENIRDYYAFTIITKKKDDAYTAYDALKELTDIDYKEFEDYISTPKKNGYQAIHIITRLKGKIDTEVEIQIKTEDMYYHATYGPASHIAYKYSEKREADGSHEFGWLENFHNSIKEHTNLRETQRSIPIKNMNYSKDLFIFTPQGKVCQLANGSTPYDFAKEVHTIFQKAATSAKINGSAAKLTNKLHTGDTVEIILDRNRLRALQT
jgi:GTP diphosphokinase / guanosine-3',5'-bis(diphosphate) 3'-diphosphatase